MRAFPPWRRALPVLLGVQGLLGTLALAWGLARDLRWWERVSPGPEVLAGLAAGLALSHLSNAIFRELSRRGVAGTRWLLDDFLGPLFQGLPPAWVLGLSLLSGVCEEAFFRGALQAELGLWASSLLFGLLHTGDRRLLLAGAWSAAVGLGLGLSYEGTGNLAVPMAVHGANNLLSFWQLSRWQPGGPGAPDGTPGQDRGTRS